MGSSKLSRRSLLKGLLGGAAVSIALPTLDIFVNSNGTAYADGTLFPKRFGMFFWGNGMLPELWNPTTTGSGSEWELSEQLAPFADVKDLISVVTGMRVMTGNDLAHAAGVGGFLSGSPIKVYGPDSYSFTEPAVDQVIAKAIGGETRFRSLEVAVQPGGQGYAYTGLDQKNIAESSPIAVYQRIFGNGFVAPGEDPIIDPKLALRRSVLSSVMGQSDQLKARVGYNDKLRLEQHFDGIRDLEVRLQRLEEDPPNLEACVRPDMPAENIPDIVEGRPDMFARNKAMVDMLAMAVACDQTRVFTNWFSDHTNNIMWPGASVGHHLLTHNEPGDQPQTNSIVLSTMESCAYMVKKFSSIQEGEGTLLDHSVILTTSDTSYGRQHLMSEFPVILAGSCNGFFKQGLHHRSETSENVVKVIFSLLMAMGVNVAEFGKEEGKVNQGLSALHA